MYRKPVYFFRFFHFSHLFSMTGVAGGREGGRMKGRREASVFFPTSPVRTIHLVWVEVRTCGASRVAAGDGDGLFRAV